MSTIFIFGYVIVWIASPIIQLFSDGSYLEGTTTGEIFGWFSENMFWIKLIYFLILVIFLFIIKLIEWNKERIQDRNEERSLNL